MLAYQNAIGGYTQQGYAFQGLNRNPFGQAGAFFDMENLTGEDAPVTRTRDRRRRLRTLLPGAELFGHDALGWISGTKVYYGGELVGTVTAGRHQIVPMGARFVIFPDKKAYNTQTGQMETLENRVNISGTVNYTACDLFGEPVEAGAAVYAKLSATGIGAGFSENDVVNITGSTVVGDGYYQIYTVTENSFVILATLDEDETAGTGVSLARDVPDMDFVTECDNRLWGCSSQNHEVYACALGDPRNWRKYQGLANDSYAVTVGSPGAFTGAAVHNGYVLFFKSDRILKLFGSRPSNYQLTDTEAAGVEAGSDGSLETMEGALFYLSPDGVMAYDGGLPGSVHGAFFGQRFENAVSCFGFGALYVSMVTGGKRCLYTFRDGLWYREDESGFTSLHLANGTLYGVDGLGNLWRLKGNDDTYAGEDAEDEAQIPWTAETGDLDMMQLFKKHVRKIQVRYALAEGSTMTISVSTDGGEFKPYFNRTGAKQVQAETYNIIPKRCDHMRIRLSGQGDVKLFNLYYTVDAG